MSALSFDPNKLTVGDLEDFEEVVGKELGDVLRPRIVRDPDTNEIELDEDEKPVRVVKLPAKAIKALVWIVKRAENPEFTLDDARKVNVSELNIESDDSEDGQGNGESA